MKSILLLTNRFPFPPGEEYLQTEIPYLSREFDEVIICPTMPGAAPTQARQLPSNVQVLQPHLSHGQLTRAKLLARGLFTPSGRIEGTTIVSRLYDRYFDARSHYVADQIEPVLNAHLRSSTSSVSAIYAYWFYITTSAAIELRRRIPELAGVPIVSRGHGYDVNESASPMSYLPARRRMLSSVESLHPTADTITARMQSEWPTYAGKISTRRLGVQLRDERPARVVDKTINILSCSSLSPVKRIPLMAQTVAHMRSMGEQVTWTHIGSGSDKQMSDLYGEVRALGISDHVTLVGQVPNDEVQTILRLPKHHVFLNTSSSESVSFSMSEALGAGLPVVATDVVGTHEIIKTGRNGVLISDSPTPDEIARGILDIAHKSDTEYLAMQDNAIKSCREHFDPDILYRGFARELAALSSDGQLE